MTSETYDEPVMLDHREWSRDGTHVLALFHRPGWSNNAWQIRHQHAYQGGGGFGCNPSFNEESEARTHFVRTAVGEDAKHAEWLADNAPKGA
ncbi:hypothetical protein [Sphingomonas aquatilis]